MQEMPLQICLDKMRCIICNGDTTRKKIEYKEFGVSLGNFNAEVCKKCGESYFDEDAAEEIQQKSKQMGLFSLAKKAIMTDRKTSMIY